MTTNGPGEQLSSKRYVTMPIRLLVDDAGGLIQGEIVDDRGRPLCRFVGWQGLNHAIRTSLTKQAGEQVLSRRPPPDR
jgi:hypothetical protein